MLSPDQVVPFLLRRKLLSSASIIAGDLKLENASRRNANLKVQCASGRSYFLKQAGNDPRLRSAITHEEAVYRHLRARARTQMTEVERYLPHSYGFDKCEGVLILELPTGAEDLLQHHSRCGRFSRRLASALGRALGALHRHTGDLSQPFWKQSALRLRAPWVLQIHNPDLADVCSMSGGNLQLVGLVQKTVDLRAALNELCDGWRVDVAIHGDLRWENCLVVPMPTGHGLGLKLVDWELAGIGDPRWDLGSAFASYLSFWIGSIPVTRDDPVERFMDLATYPLELMQPALRTLWDTYSKSMSLIGDAADNCLVGAVQYCGARLIQTAFEQQQESAYLTRMAQSFLGVSLSLLQRPKEAAVHLLGISRPRRLAA